MLKFRCKRCRKEFSFEQAAPYLKLKENLSNIHDLETLSNAIEEITKQIKCFDCQASVYLIGIGKNDLEDEIDVSSEPIIQTIKRLTDLHKKYKMENITANEILTWFASSEIQYPIAISYKNVFSLAVILILTGIGIIYFSEDKMKRSCRQIGTKWHENTHPLIPSF